MKMNLDFNNFRGEAKLEKEPTTHFNPMAEEELKLEQEFILGLSEELSVLFGNFHQPFFLRISEYKNQNSGIPTWEITATNQIYANRKDIFRSTEEMQLFTTSLHSFYVGLSTNDPLDNYCGSVNIEVMAFGNKQSPDSSWSKDQQAENLTYLSLMKYQEQIAKYYTDWNTHYLDAPTVKSWKITALEQ